MPDATSAYAGEGARAHDAASGAETRMRRRQRIRGVLLFVLGLLLFACMDATTKYLAASYEVPAIVAVRYGVNFLLMVALLGPSQGRRLVETQRTGLVLVRAACLAAASLLVGFALQLMPVAETTAINFLAPMLVVLMARPVLGERIGALGWAALVAGFAGVLMVARPGGGLDPVGVACALGAVVSNAVYQLLSRLLADSERTLALLFYTALGGTLVFGLALPFFWGGPAPDAGTIALFLSLGVYGGLGHYLFTNAYRHVPASTLAPIIYVQLLWAGLLGFLIFGHVPDRLSLAGMAVIAASGLVIALKPRAPSEETHAAR